MLRHLLFVLFVNGVLTAQVDVYQSWNNVDYNFPSGVSREELINNGSFIPNNIVTLDVDVYKYGKQGQKIFVATPWLKPGTPATLSTVDFHGLLNPYPSWEWQSQSDCSKLISVLRMTIDDCGRLWLLDDGKANVFEDSPSFICPPKVVIFNLETDELIGSYEVPTGLYSEDDSLFANIAVNSNPSNKSYAFLSDVVHHKLVVFNHQNQSFWQWDHSTVKPVSPYTNFTSNGVNFTFDDGVLALAYYPKNDRLYYNSFASLTQHSVAGQFLRNGQQLSANADSYINNYNNGTRVSQATTHALSSGGILFFNPVTENSIRCWDVTTDYTEANQPIVAQDDEILQFFTGVKVRDGRFWGVSTRLQKYVEGTTSASEINYRIITQDVKTLVRGTKCDNRKRGIFRRFFFS